MFLSSSGDLTLPLASLYLLRLTRTPTYIGPRCSQVESVVLFDRSVLLSGHRSFPPLDVDSSSSCLTTVFTYACGWQRLAMVAHCPSYTLVVEHFLSLAGSTPQPRVPCSVSSVSPRGGRERCPRGSHGMSCRWWVALPGSDEHLLSLAGSTPQPHVPCSDVLRYPRGRRVLLPSGVAACFCRTRDQRADRVQSAQPTER